MWGGGIKDLLSFYTSGKFTVKVHIFFQFFFKALVNKIFLTKFFSRRQTRITALDLIAFLAAEENPKQWLHMNDQDIDTICSTVKDQNLRLTLAFGIRIHHAGKSSPLR